MNTSTLLRVEGAAIGIAALGGPLWLFLVLALAPDFGMLGYLAGPRVGAHTYNAVHVYVGPLALGLVGFSQDVALAQYAAVVWAGHIGFDRALGYGLKRETGFGATHLDR